MNLQDFDQTDMDSVNLQRVGSESQMDLYTSPFGPSDTEANTLWDHQSVQSIQNIDLPSQDPLLRLLPQLQRNSHMALADSFPRKEKMENRLANHGLNHISVLTIPYK